MDVVCGNVEEGSQENKMESTKATVRYAQAEDNVLLAEMGERTFYDTFYEKWGFVEVERHIFVVGNDPQTDLVLQRAID